MSLVSRILCATFKSTRALLLCTLLLAFAWGIPPQAAFAAKAKVRIALMSRTPQNVSAGRAAWLQRFLRWSLRKEGRLHVMKDAEIEKRLYSKPIPRLTKARIRIFKQYLKKAKSLYTMTRFPLKRRCKYALRALDVCEKMIARVKDYLSSPRLMQKYYLYRALAYIGMMNKSKTLEWSLLLAGLDPSFDPSGETGVPANYTTYFKRLTGWLRNRPRYTMQIDSVPSGAKLYHNFQYVGTTPYTLKRLVQGKHTIKLEKRGYTTWQSVANLDPKRLGKKTRIPAKVPMKRDPKALTLKGIPIFAQDAAISDDIIDRLENIVKRLDAKHLYVVEPAKRGASHLLKFAIFTRGVRKIRYKFLPIGNSRATFRPKILRFSKWLNNRLAPAPIVRRAPRPIRRPIARRVARNDVRYIPPRRRAQVEPPRRREPKARRVAVVKPPVRPPVRETPKAGGSPFYGTWWFWTATIGGAVVAATAVVLAVNMNGPPPSATLIITTNAPSGTP